MVKTPLYATYKSRIIYSRNLAFFDKLPAGALDLLDMFLQLAPKKRPTALMALHHPFVRQSEGQDMDLSLSQDCHEMWLRESRKRNKEREEAVTKDAMLKEAMERAAYIAALERASASAIAVHDITPGMPCAASGAQVLRHFPLPPPLPSTATRPIDLAYSLATAPMRASDLGSVIDSFLVPASEYNPFV